MAFRLPRCLLLGLAGGLAFGLAATLLVPRSELGEEWARGLDLLVLVGFGLAGLQIGLVRAASASAESVKAALQSRCGAAVDLVLRSIGWPSDSQTVAPGEFRERCLSWLRNPVPDEGVPGRSWTSRIVQSLVGRKLRTEYQPVVAFFERAIQNAGSESTDQVRQSLQHELVSSLCGSFDRQVRQLHLFGCLLAGVLAGLPMLLVALTWLLIPSA